MQRNYATKQGTYEAMLTPDGSIILHIKPEVPEEVKVVKKVHRTLDNKTRFACRDPKKRPAIGTKLS